MEIKDDRRNGRLRRITDKLNTNRGQNEHFLKVVTQIMCQIYKGW